MLTVEFKLTPAGKMAGDPYVDVRIVEVSDDGDETLLNESSLWICDDEHEDEQGDFSHLCDFLTPDGIADYVLHESGFERTSPYTFHDLDGFEQSADIRRVE